MRRALAGLLLGTALAVSTAPAWAVDEPVTAKCQYNASPPTVVDGKTIAAQCDEHGQLKTTSAGSGGDASAANQTSQITQETATATGVGAPADSPWSSGSGSIIAILKGIQGKLSAALAVTQSGTWTVQPGNTANTTAWKIDGSAVTQPVSIATAPVLVAGTALIGKVGIDQTTPGTTNAVFATNLPTTVDTNSGSKSASTVRVVLATDQPTLTNAQPISAASLPLPSGAATAANQNAGSASDGSTTITSGGTAQSLFSAATPTHGWAVYNPDATEDLWVSDSTTAAANAQGSIRVVANGGGYETPPHYIPSHAVSIVGATTGHKITASKW